MLRLLTAMILFFSSGVFAGERALFNCTIQSKDILSMSVKQVITKAGDRISSTFKIELLNVKNESLVLWQSGDVSLGSDNSFSGAFSSKKDFAQVFILAPSYPNYQPKGSRLRWNGLSYKMSCASL